MSTERWTKWLLWAALIVAALFAVAIIAQSLIKPAKADAAYEVEQAYQQAITPSGYGYDLGLVSKAGGVKCKESHNRGDWKAAGLVTMRDDLVANWCWNGNRVTEVQRRIFCNVTVLGSVFPFFMKTEVADKWGRWRNWDGSPYGEFESSGRCGYQQHITWYAGGWNQERLVMHLRGNGNVVRERFCERGC